MCLNYLQAGSMPFSFSIRVPKCEASTPTNVCILLYRDTDLCAYANIVCSLHGIDSW